MSNYDLPTSIEINNNVYPIRNKGDYRVVLDVIATLNDDELTELEKSTCALYVFYQDVSTIKEEDYPEAINQCFNFISYGVNDKNNKDYKLMDWDYDFPIYIAPINRVLGLEIRAVKYLHWFTFLSAYMEIGECSFQFVVGIREKLAKGKKLEKYEKEFIEENENLVYFGSKYTEEEKALLDSIK